ncbi:AAA family ATPase [Sodalis sp. dw_96]|uniref:trifunctional serine/threonine-protein kinase/ATP-binding protein/sensor histidine kinase n=1 Tax=Sodalis sp. dw_96 TaxID=2719794 RepID=UPI0021036D09|nr:AAA family ATPase [Sodalis sp. dw_96]
MNDKPTPVPRFTGGDSASPSFDLIGLGDNRAHSFDRMSLGDNSALSFELTGFIFSPLAHDGFLSWSWCRHPVDGREYILAAAREEREIQAALQLKNEFSLRRELAESWSIKPVAYTLYHGRYALLYDAFPFNTLEPLSRAPARDMTDFITLAIRLCAPLKQMHLQGLIHGNIKPATLYIAGDGTFRLGGFGLAGSTSSLFSQPGSPALGGTLAYMSPEHTGRTKRQRDSRSDIYSLGIVLYELLTGRLPFDAGGLAEWEHHHIASEPLPPHLVRPGIPDMLSLIILKLLAKIPENRYQTVDGLKADLKRCLASLTSAGVIRQFTPGLQDTCPELHLSDTLFTDQAPARRLLSAFNEVKISGEHVLVVISGPSGIGKSSLIAAALEVLQHKRALLAVAKVDQYRRVLPFAALSSALRSLILQVLGLPAAEIARWQARLTGCLGSYAGLAVNLVPELALLLGNNVPFFDIPSVEAQDRFNHMVHRLVSAFATPGCPLVLLIDDIHWADPASMQSLEYLLGIRASLPLLTVVAHQDLASLSRPSFNRQLARLRAAAPRVVDIEPAPLDVKSMERWLGETFQTRPARMGDLAKLVHKKTGGNPFFARQFTQKIVEDGLIARDKRNGKWRYDLTAIEVRQYTENVANLVLQQLERMPATTQKLLGCLACLGRYGDIAMLSRVQGIPTAEIPRLLQPAIVAQVIVLSTDRYLFTHDRIQEAAFALLNPAEKSHLHLSAAILLAEKAPQSAGDDKLFLAVDHASCAVSLIRSAEQRRMFLELSLLAAQRAKRTGDVVSALSYLRTANALRESRRQPQNDLDFILGLEEAECEFLLGNLSLACNLCAGLADLSANRAEKAMAARLLAEIHMRRSDNRQALEIALPALALFGIHLSRRPESSECESAYREIATRIGEDPVETFNRLPPMDNREIEAAMSLLAIACVTAGFSCSRLHFLLLCQTLRLTMEYGMTGAATTALAWFGVLIGHCYGEYRSGFQYGMLARDLVRRHGYIAFEAKTLLPLEQLSVWTQPLAFTIDCANAGYAAGIANGDLTQACFARCHQVINYLARGDALDSVLSDIDRGLAFVRKARFKDVETILLIQRHYVRNMIQPLIQPPGDDGTVPTDGDDMLPEALFSSAPEQMPTMIFWLWLYQAMSHFYAGEFDSASSCLRRGDDLAWSAPGHLHLMDYHLFSALTLTVQPIGGEYSPEQRRKLQRHYDKIAQWARINPGAFEDKEALLQGEIARIDGQTAVAMAQYEKAIRLSRDGGYHHVNGLAHELAARFAGACGYATAADAHIKGAMAAYGRWGAKGNVRRLEEQYPHMVPAWPTGPCGTVAFVQCDEIRDLQSVIKASRALSEEINLGRLIQILMTMTLEQAGAQRGLLIRMTADDTPEIEARADTTAGSVNVRVVKARPTQTDLPLSVLSAVIRSGQEIRLGMPGEFSPFSRDPYLATSGTAALCVPMFKQSRLVGVLYLENRLMPEVFTAEHSKIIALLGAQAAVSLETARLYAELLEENIQRRRVEKDLRASQTSLVLGEQISHTGSWRWEIRRHTLDISAEFARIFGLAESRSTLTFTDFAALLHPDDRSRTMELIEASLRNGVTMRAEYRIIGADGANRYILGVGEPVYAGEAISEYFGTVTDITSRRQAEDAARVAQADLARVSRATTVGQLTASIAHEINQPLMSIVSNAGASLRWLNRELPRLDKARIGLEEIVAEGQRAGEIIHSLQALTRNEDPVFIPVDLHHIALHILTLSRSELERRRVSVEYALNAEAFFIFGDSVQIQQVLLNLVMNAIDAMAAVEGHPRILTLSSVNPVPQQIRFEIRDTGTGLDPAVQERVFESFYTTKKQGMGMGLAISRAIIECHRGKMTAAPRHPVGSCFSFILPIYDPPS